MDIAWIRKKLKDSKGETPGPAGTTELRHEPEPINKDELTADDKSQIKESGPSMEAPPADEKGHDSDFIELLTFSLANEEYAFRIEEILEIIKPRRITMIPKAEPYLLGITSLRGKIIPVVDLKKMLFLKGGDGENNKKQKILLLNGPKGPIGALTDRVIGVIRPAASGVVETPPHLSSVEAKFIEGVAIVDGRFISILRTSEAMDIHIH